MTPSTRRWLAAVWYAAWSLAGVILALLVILIAIAWMIVSASGCHPPCGPVRDHPTPEHKEAARP